MGHMLQSYSLCRMASPTLPTHLPSDSSLSNAPPPAHFAADDIRSFEVVQLVETFQVYFVTQLLVNVTNNVTGFEIPDAAAKADVIAKLTTIQRQQQFHALAAGGALQHFNMSQIQPCVFKSPAVDFPSAIQTISNVTALVISTLQDVAVKVGKNGDTEVVCTVVSIAGQEGEEAGVYRICVNNLIPLCAAVSDAIDRRVWVIFASPEFHCPG